MANFVYHIWCMYFKLMWGGHLEGLNLTWLVNWSPLAAWTCWVFLPVLPVVTDALLSPTLWGVTLPVSLELNLLCPLLLLGNPSNTDPRLLAWLSWALIRSFCLVSWAISASMASGETSELRGSDVNDNEEVEGRLERGRLVRLDTELSLQERGIFKGECSWCGSTAWVTEEEGGKGSWVRWHEDIGLKSDVKRTGLLPGICCQLSLCRGGESNTAGETEAWSCWGSCSATGADWQTVYNM